jgi:hypothetical protein
MPTYASRGWTVARTGVGVYVVTLTDPFDGYRDTRCALRPAALTPVGMQPGLVNKSARTFTINAFNTTTGAAADIAFDANTWIDFAIDVSMSKVR